MINMVKQKRGTERRFADKVVALKCHYPSVVIHLDILFTNFGPDKCGAAGGLLAIASGHDIAFIEEAERFVRLNRNVSRRVLYARAGDGTRVEFHGAAAGLSGQVRRVR